MTWFSGSPLDRVDHVRADPDAYAALRYDVRARLLALDAVDPRLDDAGRLSWTNMAALDDDAEVVLLGLLEGKPHFATIPPVMQPAAMRTPAMARTLAMLPGDDAAIYGTALSLIGWHGTHKFCSRCGGATAWFRAGWGRRCTVCATEHFPRTDPVVIMLAEHADRVLVGRQARFPKGSYSALAGFLEPGEAIEEAVARELLEEAGIAVGAIRYVASQPWPFGGSQLMIGCIAQAEHDVITIDPRELEDAMWVTRAEVTAAMAGASDARFIVPPRYAIAHTLFERWLAG